MNAFSFGRLRSFASCGLALAGCLQFFAMSAAGAQSVPMTPAMMYRAAHYRVFAPKLRPRHIRTFGMRADRVGDTPYSSKYYKVTNITAEVGGFGGTAYAVNNDGRIAYTDLGSTFSVGYIVNNGGTFGQLAAPLDAFPEGCSVHAYALNEKAQVVGDCEGEQEGSITNVAWTLAGARGSRVAYWGDYIASEESGNDHDVGVGWAISTSNSEAAAYLGDSNPAGETVGLYDLNGFGCDGDNVSAINDAGEMVGNSCVSFTAVRFRLAGNAEPLPITPANSVSFAYAINQRGDVVGQAGATTARLGAYLLRDRKTIYLPAPKGFPNFTDYAAFGVNASDEVVGDVWNGAGSDGFVYVNGRSYDLNTLLPPNSGWVIVDALGVNDHGEIVGDGYYNGNLYGVSLKPPV